MGRCPFFHDEYHSLVLTRFHKGVTSLFLAGLSSNFHWFIQILWILQWRYLEICVLVSFLSWSSLLYVSGLSDSNKCWFLHHCIYNFTSVPIWLYPWPVFWSEILFIEGSILANVYPIKILKINIPLLTLYIHVHYKLVIKAV